jgi:hypothetical protein
VCVCVCVCAHVYACVLGVGTKKCSSTVTATSTERNILFMPCKTGTLALVADTPHRHLVVGAYDQQHVAKVVEAFETHVELANGLIFGLVEYAEFPVLLTST